MPANSDQYARWRLGKMEMRRHKPGDTYNFMDVLDYTCKPGFVMAPGSGRASTNIMFSLLIKDTLFTLLE